ncbi:hypothetical protein CSB93_0472 [Pseudomonas paraeruginosa]|uniref:Uncharacterized protein n=1 Tax=Pseudomonas paraeruginosa TaxID=2994495 RepID=A0A2R3J393_9PSED|nr:hypothetical protein CSB93_0472 [Pseudomonas paraeruginosa]AWE93710.1 hypothetical protein CSC28_5785 [Pseudomonas paraeruginosa]PTC34110.1 hypothetical protein CLJ1_5318 [Pseudomonas aeruginosa]
MQARAVFQINMNMNFQAFCTRWKESIRIRREHIRARQLFFSKAL